MNPWSPTPVCRRDTDLGEPGARKEDYRRLGGHTGRGEVWAAVKQCCAGWRLARRVLFMFMFETAADARRELSQETRTPVYDTRGSERSRG